MTCNPSKILAVSICLAVFATGCAPTLPSYLHESNGLSHYLDHATQIDYPDVEYATLDEVTLALSPLTVIESDFDHYTDMTLEYAVHYALSNTKIIRGYGTPSLQNSRVVPGQDNLTNGPAVAASSYDIAIRESDVGFIGPAGQMGSPSSIRTNTGLDANQGVEAALAEFDAKITSSFSYGKSDEPKNGTSFLNSAVFQQNQVSWQSEIAKKSANGTQMFFRQVNQYTDNNNPLVGEGGIQELDSWYRTSFEAEIRQPLLRGRGAFINRMPVVISKIGTDQEIANLESTLQNMVTNVEIRYWDLYLAYRSFDAAVKGRNAALETYHVIKNQFDEGAEANIQQVAQATEQYWLFVGQVSDMYTALLTAEGDLRHLLGWSPTDGNFIRPIDDPVMAPVEFDWDTSLGETLSYRPELRRERWEIKKLQLAHAYSKNGLLPEFDVSMMYRWLGLGNKYGTSGDQSGFPAANSAALNELYDGNYQEVQLSGSYAMPVGFRREKSVVRNAELRLARQIARVEDLELNMVKELTDSIRALANNLTVMQSSFGRWTATTVEKRHFENEEEAGVGNLTVALDAQKRRAISEISFYTALCEYNKGIALVHRRKGTILAYSGIAFNEGAWNSKAYSDARENARRRAASKPAKAGWSRPQVISRGESQVSGGNIGMEPMVTATPANDPSIESRRLPSPAPSGSGGTFDGTTPAPILEGGTIAPSAPTLAIPFEDEASLNQQSSPVIQRVSFEDGQPTPDWSKFGLERPAGSSDSTTASIKIN